MKARIIARNSEHGFHTVYLEEGGKEYYLFRQAWYRGVEDYFGNGAVISDALDRSKAKCDRSVLRTMDRIIPGIRYVEKQYGISVLSRTKKAGTRRNLAECA